MMQYDLISLAEAMKAKDEALAKVAANSGDWMALALLELEAMIHAFPATFTGEFIRMKLAPSIGKPHSPNAWGALTGTAIKRKLIEPTGQYTAMLAKKSHGRKTALYRKRHATQ
jgi:hypothetical protein